jgi:glycosyltransferase involved in cell wall biosynthesis
LNNINLVSVIVPTRNSACTLETCLKSIKNQSYPKIEIIVVDNHSQDLTQEIAEKYGQLLIRGPERSAQRNAGARIAHGEYLFFVDSDMELTPKVVEECMFDISIGYDALIVNEITMGQGLFSKVRSLERSVYVGDLSFECSRFFRRGVFENVYGYDEALTGPEDFDLQSKIEKAGFRVGHIISPIFHHEENLSLPAHLRKKFYYSKSFNYYARKHPEKASQQLGLQRMFKYWSVIAQSPVIGVLVFLLKASEYLMYKAAKF